MVRTVLAVPAAMMIIITGCGRASSESEAKQWSTPEPPALVEIPTGLAITVQVDGVLGTAITAETLHGKTPDFTDPEHKAWLLPTLVAEAAPTGTVVAAFDAEGASVTFTHPMTDGFEPVLFLTRRGDLIVSAVNPKDPFPRFHGQGGRLRRPGDTNKPRLTNVTRIAITHAK
ncbi:MAG: hypothetical protein NT062_20580 [Proteobacteria bacterium]|nr:hypothetical protein [Pseudomonadota bacterium]